MSAYPSRYRSPPRTTEFEVLKAAHRFLRDEGTTGQPDSKSSWDDQLAQKYEASLYREFAVCDLKHYKTGNFRLRWRTEDEVLAGSGENTCGNTRCVHYAGLDDDERGYKTPPLTVLELPFAYEEGGEHKNALVKAVLCSKCVKKLMWKRNKDQQQTGEGADGNALHRRNSRSRSPRRHM